MKQNNAFPILGILVVIACVGLLEGVISIIDVSFSLQHIAFAPNLYARLVVYGAALAIVIIMGRRGKRWCLLALALFMLIPVIEAENPEYDAIKGTATILFLGVVPVDTQDIFRVDTNLTPYKIRSNNTIVNFWTKFYNKV